METPDDHRERLRKPWLDTPKQRGRMPNVDRRQEISERNGDIRPEAGQSAEHAAPTHDMAQRVDMTGDRNDGKRQVGVRAYAAFEADFRSHHQRNDAERRGSYEQYRPVYRYGYDLGVDPRYRNADWPTVTDCACPVWEARNPGTWEEFKDTIRYAWDMARGPR